MRFVSCSYLEAVDLQPPNPLHVASCALLYTAPYCTLHLALLGAPIHFSLGRVLPQYSTPHTAHRTVTVVTCSLGRCPGPGLGPGPEHRLVFLCTRHVHLHTQAWSTSAYTTVLQRYEPWGILFVCAIAPSPAGLLMRMNEEVTGGIGWVLGALGWCLAFCDPCIATTITIHRHPPTLLFEPQRHGCVRHMCGLLGKGSGVWGCGMGCVISVVGRGCCSSCSTRYGAAAVACRLTSRVTSCLGCMCHISACFMLHVAVYACDDSLGCRGLQDGACAWCTS